MENHISNHVISWRYENINAKPTRFMAIDAKMSSLAGMVMFFIPIATRMKRKGITSSIYR
jgi:hypothetical protein